MNDIKFVLHEEDGTLDQIVSETLKMERLELAKFSIFSHILLADGARSYEVVAIMRDISTLSIQGICTHSGAQFAFVETYAILQGGRRMKVHVISYGVDKTTIYEVAGPPLNNLGQPRSDNTDATVNVNILPKREQAQWLRQFAHRWWAKILGEQSAQDEIVFNLHEDGSFDLTISNKLKIQKVELAKFFKNTQTTEGGEKRFELVFLMRDHNTITVSGTCTVAGRTLAFVETYTVVADERELRANTKGSDGDNTTSIYELDDPPEIVRGAEPMTALSKISSADCSICLSSLLADGHGVELSEFEPCAHVFHTECIALWQGSCPNCRGKSVKVRVFERKYVEQKLKETNNAEFSASESHRKSARRAQSRKRSRSRATSARRTPRN